MPSSSQNNASDKLTVHSSNAVTTAGGVVLTGVTTYASSYIRKTGMDPRDPIFTLDVRTGNSRQVKLHSQTIIVVNISCYKYSKITEFLNNIFFYQFTGNT